MPPFAEQSDKTENNDIPARKRWLAVMARADLDSLEVIWQNVGADLAYDILRAPEVGLIMARGRAGGTGQAFNLGEVSVTRATIRLTAAGIIGHGYLMGRKQRQSLLIALLDAYLQLPDASADFIEELARDQQKQRQQHQAESATSKVDFFTLVRGEDD